MPIVAGEKFELRLIRSSDILLHEDSENDRSARLARRFREEKILYNPLIIGRFRHRYLLIDGANRFEALKRISISIVLAQVVDYFSKNVLLKSWYHFINGLKHDSVIKFLNKNKISFKNLRKPVKPSLKNEIVISGRDGRSIKLKLEKDLRSMLFQLCRVNRFYEGKYTYSRIDSDTDIDDMSQISDNDGLLIMYPDFSKEQIISIAGMDKKLPAGITRHLIPNRVLHIKYPIAELSSVSGLEKKNSKLLSFIIEKVKNKKVRLYREPLLIFDEY